MPRRAHCLDMPIAAATATLLLCPLLAYGASAETTVAVERQVMSMGTRLWVHVTAPTRAAALAASEAAILAVEEVERRLSTWRPDTELAALNGHPPGIAFALSPQLAADLAAVARLWRLTGGAFDPGLGALVAAWDLRGRGRQPTVQELAAARAASGLQHLRLTGSHATRLHPAFRLEEGGFGKGAGLDAARAAVATAGAHWAWLDFGGQMAVWGHSEGLEVSLSHPEERGRSVATLRLLAGSISTSGNGPRRREGRAPHVLDPRTGRPARDFGSLTVWAASALEADALSTGLYVLGPEAALEWAQRHPQYGVIVLEMQGSRTRLRLSGALTKRQLPLAVEAIPSSGDW